MSDTTCESVRELIPDLMSDRLELGERTSVEGHVSSCAECAAELELAQLLWMSRAEVPEGLSDRLRAAMRSRKISARRRWWGLSVAAAAALALGIGLASKSGPEVEVTVPGYAYEVVEGSIWLSEDGLLAGAPSFDGLSDEALDQLLDELSVGTSGGAA